MAARKRAPRTLQKPLGLPEVAQVALGAFATTQALKTALPWPMRGWTKLATTFLAAAGQSFIRTRNPVEAVVKNALPATGLAAVIHRISRVAQTSSDQDIVALGTATESRRGRYRFPTP